MRIREVCRSATLGEILDARQYCFAFGSIFRKIFPQLRKESVIDDYGHGLPVDSRKRVQRDEANTREQKPPDSHPPPLKNLWVG